MAEPVCVAPTGDICGEGAVWHAAENALYWTDINRFLIHRYDAASGNVKTWFFDEPVTAMILTSSPATLAVVLGIALDSVGASERYAPRLRIPSCRAGPRCAATMRGPIRAASLWIGTMWNNVNADGSLGEIENGHGVLYRLDPDLAATEFRSGSGNLRIRWLGTRSEPSFILPIPWRMSFISTTTMPLPAISTTSGPSFVTFGRGSPDGSAMDADGFLWNCRYGGGCIVRVAPTAHIDRSWKCRLRTSLLALSAARICARSISRQPAAGAKPGDRFAGGLFSLAD